MIVFYFFPSLFCYSPMKAKQITKKDIQSMQKAAHRQALIDQGLYNIHREKSHKDKTKYSRKDNKKVQLD